MTMTNGATNVEDLPFPELTETDVKADVAAFNEAIAPDAPEIRPPGPDEVILDYGYVVDGVNHKRAIVRELTGSDEEALSKLTMQRMGDAYFVGLEDMVLRRAVVRIGDFTPADHPDMLSSLLIGDRGKLFMAILRVTYGDEKEYERVPCPQCQELNDFLVEWPNLVKHTPMVTDAPETEIKLIDGTTLGLRYPTGADQWQVYQEKKEGTESERNTVMISRCITNTDIANKKRFALELGVRDRKACVKVLVENPPAVTFEEAEVPCPACNEPIKFVFSWADLLLG